MTAALLLFFQSCEEEAEDTQTAIVERDSLPILKSRGVSTMVSDSGIVRYKLISEDWYVYDKKNPSYWSFEKGLFIERFNESFHVDAFISCDTAYYYDQKRLWELRGRVFVKNLKGETFKTCLLYWDQGTHEIYSDCYMEIDGETQKLAGNKFRSNEEMTNYIIHSSNGQFPISEHEETPTPDPAIMAQQQQENNENPTKQE